MTLELRLHRIIFFRNYQIVRFSLRVKVLRFRFEVTWYRGDFGGKSPTTDFFQALQSTAVYVACEGTTFQVLIPFVQG